MCFLLYFIGYNHYGFWCVFYFISLVITTMVLMCFLLYFIGYNHYGFWCVFLTLFHWL